MKGKVQMDKEEQIILKARMTTLEMYLQDVFIFLKDVIDSTVGREHSTRNIKLRDIKRQVEGKLKKFREDLQYQDEKQIELENREIKEGQSS